MRDPYYQKILAGLDGTLDPNVFEACAVDLLRDAYPGLVPIRGGLDAGMDGAIADGEGEAYPLVATTAKSVIGNLTKNLDSYVRHGGKRRRIVVATSRALTARRRRNLEQRAREKGFVLVQVHERFDLAGRLLRDSRWAHELLGITGEPSALSAVPRTRRPLPEVELVGRDADLEWLRESRGDRLVVGQPGSGKTALLLQLVREGRALFLASDDEGKIADACGDLEPPVILVDDAHVEIEKLDRLRQIRQEIKAAFELVASTWPGAEEDVADALGGISGESIRRLELLTRKEIVQVLRSIGVSLPDDNYYLGLLVDQAANKPGLAVTLGSLWLRGEAKNLVTGKAIRRSFIPTLRRCLEYDPTQLLACFALGGDQGMSLEPVGEFLGIGRGEVYRRATLASQGGVLLDHRDGCLSVEPEALRSALLDDVFFTPPLLPYRELLDDAPNRGDAVETLALAAWRGVAVPRGEFQTLLQEAGTPDAWRAFAATGESEARWVLGQIPVEDLEDLIALADVLLVYTPRPTIQRLLREAETPQRPTVWTRPEALRQIQTWIQDIPDSRHYESPLDESLRRRQVLIEEAKVYLQQGGNRTVGLKACFLALSLLLGITRETVTGAALTSRSGSLPASSVPRLLELWEEVLEELGETTSELWSALEQLLWEWLWPTGLTEAEVKAWRKLPRQVLQDLAPGAQGRPGFTQALKRWAHRAGLTLYLESDEDFEVLFPHTDHVDSENWKQEEENQEQAARELATRWAGRPAAEVSRQLAFYEAEAQTFGNKDSQARWVFCDTQAAEVAVPEEWLRAFLQEALPARWVGPLLHRVVRERRPGWAQALRRCFESEAYAWLAADVTIRSEEMPEELLSAALAASSPELVEGACRRGQVPLDTVGAFLRHPRQEIAVAAVVGEWLADPRGEVRPELGAEWREAVLRLGSEGRIERTLHSPRYWLMNILNSDADLAADWLAARLEHDHEHELLPSNGIYAAAIQPLAANRRGEFLRRLQPDPFTRQLIPLLVGRSPEVYQCLLAEDRLKRYHVIPLEFGPPDTVWVGMAQTALEAGIEPEEIAHATFRHPEAIAGYGVDHWGKWREALQTLLKTQDGKLREVAEHGLASANARIAEGMQRERHFEMTGEHWPR